ncbi:MAG: energy transducer TonB [Methylotenera sp.]|nr:energy transducer TonB [Methylotenera sp.]
MSEYFSNISWDKLSGLIFVLAIHGALLYAAMSYKLIPPPQEAVTLFVNLINPPQKKEEPPPPEPPKPPPKKVELVKEKPIVRPQPAPILVAEAPVISATEPVAPPPQPIIEEPPAPVIEEPAKPVGPVVMSSELSLACPDRNPPNYPAISRRLGEQGQVKLKVELDEAGRVISARVVESSGYKRLDEAGLAAVKSWRCNAATRDGKAVRAVALQPFDFILN